jgi:hypothetical protein
MKSHCSNSIQSRSTSARPAARAKEETSPRLGRVNKDPAAADA